MQKNKLLHRKALPSSPFPFRTFFRPLFTHNFAKANFAKPVNFTKNKKNSFFPEKKLEKTDIFIYLSRHAKDEKVRKFKFHISEQFFVVRDDAQTAQSTIESNHNRT